YVHQLPVNGVFVGNNVCFVKETASLRKVEGGIDEPIPRVSSHEIGHALTLPHRQDKFNLMASGTTGTLLNEDQVGRSWASAKKMAGMMTPAECESALRAAEKEGDAARAKRLRTALAALPKDAKGAGAKKEIGQLIDAIEKALRAMAGNGEDRDPVIVLARD